MMMGFGDCLIDSQREDDFLHKQKHQGYMRAALDVVYHVGYVEKVRLWD